MCDQPVLDRVLALHVAKVELMDGLVAHVGDVRPNRAAPSTILVAAQAAVLHDQTLAPGNVVRPGQDGPEFRLADSFDRGHLAIQIGLPPVKIVLVVATPATGVDQLAFQHWLGPMRDTPMRVGQNGGASLAQVTDGAAELVRRMMLQNVPRVGRQGLRLILKRRIVDRHVTVHATVDPTESFQVDLPHLDRIVDGRLARRCGQFAQPRGVLLLVAAPFRREILFISRQQQQRQTDQTRGEQQDLHPANTSVVHRYLTRSRHELIRLRRPPNGSRASPAEETPHSVSLSGPAIDSSTSKTPSSVPGGPWRNRSG